MSSRRKTCRMKVGAKQVDTGNNRYNKSVLSGYSQVKANPAW